MICDPHKVKVGNYIEILDSVNALTSHLRVP